MRIFSYVYDSPMGSLYLCADDSRLHGIWSDKAEAAEYIDVVTEKGDGRRQNAQAEAQGENSGTQF